jgi:hypothetical protein
MLKCRRSHEFHELWWNLMRRWAEPSFPVTYQVTLGVLTAATKEALVSER